jgi:glycosyltransferase involved in cell wall biosynthesis
MMHDEWESAANTQGSYLAVCWQRIRRRALGMAVRLSPVEAAQNGNPLVFASTGIDIQENAWRDDRAASRPDLMAPDDRPQEPGVNLVGYISAEMGIGQGARNLVRAARCAGLKCAVKPVSTEGLHREQDLGIEDDIDHPYPVNVIYVNADRVPSTLQALGEDFLRGHRNIGYWHWELEEFPEDFNSAFDCLDEVWTASRFCQDSISRLSPVPVIRIPHAVEVANPPARSRSDFGLPEDRFLFLMVFDMLSVFERKNPLGVVRAFIEAFAGDPATHLAIKIGNTKCNPAAMRDLSDAIQSYPITLIDRVMDRVDVDALLQVSDCLVSLHRSEGFGLCLAEAMYLGKPVIATAYSGNTDFMTSDNSFLVGYRLSTVPEGCPPYRAGAVWANPILGDAVSQMQLVRTAELWRNTVGKRAQDHIRQHLSPSVVGTLVRQRIERLLRSRAVERNTPRSATLSRMPP